MKAIWQVAGLFSLTLVTKRSSIHRGGVEIGRVWLGAEDKWQWELNEASVKTIRSRNGHRNEFLAAKELERRLFNIEVVGDFKFNGVNK
jgi:hypothetical protein